MAVKGLEDQLNGLSLADADHLLFHPSADIERRNPKFDDVPRYLFRVFTKYSEGSIDVKWAKSMDAKNGIADSIVDVFSQPPALAAQRIHRHLQGSGLADNRDNLVSWTCSLLYALVYIFHLRAKIGNVETFDQIYLCVLDTSSFPEGVFVRDLDLIRAYRSANLNLRKFEILRHNQRKPLAGYYYFGEYLSQGSLKIEGQYQVVSAQSMIDQGLYIIRDEFREFSTWERENGPKWAIPVIEMRESIYSGNVDGQTKSELKVKSALAIAELFGPRWKLPIAAHLAALTAPRIDGDIVLAKFRTFPNDERENCSPSKTKISDYDTLPEVQQYGIIMRNVYKYYCLDQLRKLLIEARVRLRMATTFTATLSQREQTFALVDLELEDSINRLRTISSRVIQYGIVRSKTQKGNFDEEGGVVDEDIDTRDDSENGLVNLIEAESLTYHRIL